MKLKDKKVVVIGGSSGMGLAIAKAAAKEEADLTISSRSATKLENALAEFERDINIYPADLTDDKSVKDLFERIGAIDHLIISGSSVSMAGFYELSIEKAMASMNSKFWGVTRAVKMAQINSGGSITLFSGTLSRKPTKGTTIVSAINAAVEGLGRALAIELAPIRVNVISPGLVETPIFADVPESERKSMFENAASNLPVGRIGKPEDIAAVAMMLMTNSYMTGTVVDIDGGSLLS